MLEDQGIDTCPLGAEHWPLDAQRESAFKEEYLTPTTKDIVWLVATPPLVQGVI